MPRPRRAFSLVELLVVVTIILLLLAFAMPRVKSGIDESKIRESSRQLSSFLATARTRAVSSGRVCGLQLIGQQTAPGCWQATQCQLVEEPQAYTGDFLDSRVTYTYGSGPAPLVIPQLIFSPSGAEASLRTLVADGEHFRIEFDHRVQFDLTLGLLWDGYRSGNDFFVVIPFGIGCRPPSADPAGYAFRIFRQPQPVGNVLSLPRGTAIDLSYSGLGAGGADFAGASAVTALFSPDGGCREVRVQNSSGQSKDISQRTAYFLVGRPEKTMEFSVASPMNGGTNLVDDSALWVAVGRLTGGSSSAENSFQSVLPIPNPTFQDYLAESRRFARERDGVSGR